MQMASAGMKQRGCLFAMWQDLALALPRGSDHQSRARREELFDVYDIPGEGVLLQVNVVKGVLRRLPYIPGMSDPSIVLKRVFKAVVENVPPVATIGMDKMDRNQFRFLMLGIWHYFKLYDFFISRGNATGRKATLEDFEAALPMLREWGCNEVDAWEAEPARAFAAMNRGGGVGAGGVLFDDLADVCLRRCLQKWHSIDDDEERRHAIHLLSRTHPHMVADKALRRRPGFTGSAPPVPPPGQRRPPQVEAPDPRGLAKTKEQWKTNYKQSYVTPSLLPAPKTAKEDLESSVRASSQQPRHAYAWQRPERGVLVRSMSVPPGVGAGASAAASGAGTPAAATRMPQGHGGQDRVALRSKLDRQLDGYSTMQMRNLLAVAGGFTVGGRVGAGVGLPGPGAGRG